MDTIFLRRRILWPMFCVILFFIFIKQDDLSNNSYNQYVKGQSYCVKVLSIKKEAREYYVYGIDRKGQILKLDISSKWDLHTVQVGDSLIKKRNSFDIKLVSKHKSIILTPDLPL